MNSLSSLATASCQMIVAALAGNIHEVLGAPHLRLWLYKPMAARQILPHPSQTKRESKGGSFARRRSLFCFSLSSQTSSCFAMPVFSSWRHFDRSVESDSQFPGLIPKLSMSRLQESLYLSIGRPAGRFAYAISRCVNHKQNGRVPITIRLRSVSAAQTLDIILQQCFLAKDAKTKPETVWPAVFVMGSMTFPVQVSQKRDGENSESDVTHGNVVIANHRRHPVHVVNLLKVHLSTQKLSWRKSKDCQRKWRNSQP